MTIERATTADRLGVFGRAAGLSLREAEVLGHLVEGTDTHAIADRLYISAHTVQDHVKSILAKAGAGHRREVLAMIAGR